MKTVVLVGGFAESLVNFRGELIREMVGAGYRVIACAPEKDSGIERRLAALGAEYRRVSLSRTGINPFRDLWTFVSLFLFFRQCRPDFFLGYTVKPVIFGSLAARCAGVRCRCAMITGLGYAFAAQNAGSGLLRRLVCFLYRLALSGNHVVFFQNRDDRNLFVALNLVSDRNKTVVVNGSGVDLDHFAPADLPRQISFLLIARLLRDKGIYEYVQAARTIKKDFPETLFHLVGWSDSNPAAIGQNEVDGWEREGVIRFWGRLEDVRPAIAACTVYVLPSYREGTPRTVLEAMAMGRAIITTDTAGCRETVQDGVNGFLVPVGNVDLLVRAMKKFLTNPAIARRMGQESLRLARERYDVRKVNRVILSSMGILGHEQDRGINA